MQPPPQALPRARRAAALLLGLLLALLPWSPPATGQAGGPGAERIALVVGNAAYRDQPLPNPHNDARAVATLLERAGFKVELQTDVRRQDLQRAIEGFGERLRRDTVRMAVFYYAGHGFQLDWRNYLVPVDARVDKAADVTRQTVDISELLRRMQARSGRSHLVILDACRDDPFGGGWRPPLRGLSPFDAPAGSLLAYSTAPGQVAYDGREGGNGLYTHHLVRELAVPDASVEDAFKRVRLNVRLASRGRQVPWEMGSLEENLVLFPQSRERAAASEAELEARFERELAAWNEVRRSDSVTRLAEFLRAHPSGHSSELAQARLNRLLADELRKAAAATSEVARRREADALADQLHAQASTPAAPTATAAAAAPPPAAAPPLPPATPAARPPVPAPLQATASEPALPPLALAALPLALAPTPQFSGQQEHRRDFRVGDRYVHRVVDGRGQELRRFTLQVSAVDALADRVEFNGGEFVADLMGNISANPRGAMSTPRQFYPAEFALGRKWRTEFKQARTSGWTYHFRYDLKVAARETITVPAGTFDTWRIEAHGFNVGLAAHIRRTIWVAPGVAADIAHETTVRLRNGVVEQDDRQELVELPRRPPGG